MKKITILTSILALAACGGGSGGKAPDIQIPKELQTSAINSVTIDQAAANKSMVNFVGNRIPEAYTADATDEEKLTIATNLLNNMHTTLQALSDLQVSGDADALRQYIANHQTDVKNALSLYFADFTPSSDPDHFYMNNYNRISSDKLNNFEKKNGFVSGTLGHNDMDFYNTSDQPVKIQFSNGKITGIDFDNGLFKQLSPDGTIRIEEDYTKNPDYDPTTDPVYGAFTGKATLLGNTVGLQYSDFGYVLSNGTTTYSDGHTEQNNDGHIFFGGYIPHEIKATESGTMTFNGTAIAVINSHTYDSDSGVDNFDTMTSTVNDAKLTVNNGNEVLTANFSKAQNPWYDVIISKDSATLVNSDSEIPVEYQVKNTTGSTSPENDFLRAKYYGDNGQISEAVAGSHFYTTGALSDERITHEIDADIGFGGKL